MTRDDINAAALERAHQDWCDELSGVREPELHTTICQRLKCPDWVAPVLGPGWGVCGRTGEVLMDMPQECGERGDEG